jgi:hypothetical protein
MKIVSDVFRILFPFFVIACTLIFAYLVGELFTNIGLIEDIRETEGWLLVWGIFWRLVFGFLITTVLFGLIAIQIEILQQLEIISKKLSNITNNEGQNECPVAETSSNQSISNAEE